MVIRGYGDISFTLLRYKERWVILRPEQLDRYVVFIHWITSSSEQNSDFARRRLGGSDGDMLQRTWLLMYYEHYRLELFRKQDAYKWIILFHIPFCLSKYTSRGAESILEAEQKLIPSIFNSVGIAMSYWFDGRSWFATWISDFSLLHAIQTGSGPHTSYSATCKQPRAEADGSFPTKDEDKNSGAIPPIPHTSLWRCS
jgi:hypothetical protein